MKKVLYLLLCILVIGIIGFMYVYKLMFSSNTSFESSEIEVFVPTGTSLDTLVSILDDGVINDVSSFKSMAKLMKLEDTNIKPGRYLIDRGISNRAIIGIIRGGLQTPVKVTFNNQRTVEELAGALTRNIETDSLTMLKYLKSDEFLNKYNLSPATVMTLFLPDTYEFFWTVKPEIMVERLAQYTDDFWKSRAESLRNSKMSKEEIYTLASIVEKESNLNSERPDIAGVYFNRLNQGIPLQADPTVVFAWQNFELKRVLHSHLQIDSPYNTYKYPGLPPGPIFMPSKASIEAVLNASNHEYLYFCAKPGYNSGHSFAKNLAEHGRNARIYQDWLNSEGIN